MTARLTWWTGVYVWGTYLVQTTAFVKTRANHSWKPVQTMVKKSSKFIKKITHIDDIMIHNLVKYLVQTLFRLWDVKITNFYLTNEVEFGQDILHDCISSYHLHVWFFLMNLYDLFAVVCTGFYEVVVCTRYVPVCLCVTPLVVYQCHHVRPRSFRGQPRPHGHCQCKPLVMSGMRHDRARHMAKLWISWPHAMNPSGA